MALDPSLPALNSPDSSAEMRAQLTSLHDLIHSRPTTPEVQNEIGLALQGTSNNSNGVTALGSSASLAYDQTQMQEVIKKIDELINALRR